MVVTLLSYGCPLQAMVHAFGLDERTGAAWQKRAGKHCQRVHTALVEQGKVESQHIQADAHPSKRQEAHSLLLMTKGWKEFNTSFIERLNGTIRSRLASFTRKCRHAAARLATREEGMYLIGCTSNLCLPHHELSKTAHFGCPTTPAMAASLTDHIWSMSELLRYKIAPSPFGARKPAK